MKQNQIILLVITVIGILLFGNQLGFFSIFQFEYDFLPYGESIHEMTGIGVTCPPSESPHETIWWETCNGKYWTLETSSFYPYSSMVITGNDFEMMTNLNGVSGNSQEAIFTTTEDFSGRDFKVNLVVPTYSLYGAPYANAIVKVSILNSQEEKFLISFDRNTGGEGFDKNVIISPSVISDEITLYVNGEKVGTFELSESLSNEYNVQIDFKGTIGWKSTGVVIPKLIINTPSYRQQFGCTKEPWEQYYVTIFKEGDNVNLNKLDNFNKFCLADAPAKIYTNVGSTTNTELLRDLVEGEQYTVPLGQIWSVEYIGDITEFKTECEEGEVYVDNENTCMARTVVSLTCPEDSEFSFDRGICVVETEPFPYLFHPISTHESLEARRQFLFTYILDNYDEYSPSSFQIGINTFLAGGVQYMGSIVDESISSKDEPDKWYAYFSFLGTNYLGRINEKHTLNDYFSVEFSDIEAYKPKGETIKRFKVDYLFSLDNDFLDTSYTDGKLAVLNTWQSFDGGIVITKTDNLGTTTIEKVERKLDAGETVFDIDVINILELKVRPFIIIETPQFTYNFDAKEAVIVDLSKIVELTATIQEQIDIINSLQITINEKADIINSLNLNLQEQLDLISQLELTSQEKTDLISQLELTLQNQADLISQLELTSQQQAQIIDSLELSISDQAVLITQMELTSQQQVDLISQLQLSVSEQADLISQLELTSQQQAQIIDSLELSISGQADLINQLNLNLAEKVALISQLEITNQEQADLISQMELSFSDQANIISSLETLISDDAIIITGLYDTISEQAQLISELDYTNQQLSQLVTELDLTIVEQAQLISELDYTNQQLSQLIIEFDLTILEQADLISQLQVTVITKGEIIEGLKLSLEEEAQIIDQLGLTIDEQIMIIAELDLTIGEEQELVSQLKLTIEQQQLLIEGLENYKKPIEFSEIWEQHKILIMILAGFILVLFFTGGRKR